MAAFGRLNYKPPNRKQLAGRLLEAQYEEERQTVELALADAQLVSFTVDGSDDTSGNRIMNICCMVESGEVYLLDLDDTGEEQHTAEYLARWLKDRVFEAIQGTLCLLISWHLL